MTGTTSDAIITSGYLTKFRCLQKLFSLKLDEQNTKFFPTARKSEVSVSELISLLQVNLCHKLLLLHQLNPQYDDRLFIELQIQYMKIPSSNLARGEHNCVQILFLTFRTIFVHNTFSPCCAKKRELLTKIYRIDLYR